MRRMKYHIYLNSEERCLLISSLNDLRNRLIAEGKYTDLVDEVMQPTQKLRKSMWSANARKQYFCGF